MSKLVLSSPSPGVSSAIIEAWNKRNPVGSPIIFITDSAQPVVTTVTEAAGVSHNTRCAGIAHNGGTLSCLDRLVSYTVSDEPHIIDVELPDGMQITIAVNSETFKLRSPGWKPVQAPLSNSNDLTVIKLKKDTCYKPLA